MLTRKLLRHILTWFLGCVVLVILVSVVGEWFIHVADDKGWYRNAGANWDRAVSAIPTLVSSGWVLYPATLLGGMVAGLWADAILARRERRASPPPESHGELGRSEESRTYTPVPLPAPKPKFNYPYKKAVLAAAFPPASGSRDADGMIEMSATIVVENRHPGKIQNCSVHIVNFMENKKLEILDESLRMGHDPSTKEPVSQFELEKNQQKRVRFIHRDMRDRISKPPFVLRLMSGDRPLFDNSRYIMSIELRSEYEHPTQVGLQIDIGEEGKISLTLLDQSV